MLNHPLQGHGASPYRVWTHWGYLLWVGGLDSPASDFGKPCVSYKCVFPANKDSIQENPSAKNKICTTHEWVTRSAGPVDVDSGYFVGLSLIRAGLRGKQVKVVVDSEMWMGSQVSGGMAVQWELSTAVANTQGLAYATEHHTLDGRQLQLPWWTRNVTAVHQTTPGP